MRDVPQRGAAAARLRWLSLSLASWVAASQGTGGVMSVLVLDQGPWAFVNWARAVAPSASNCAGSAAVSAWASAAGLVVVPPPTGVMASALNASLAAAALLATTPAARATLPAAVVYFAANSSASKAATFDGTLELVPGAPAGGALALGAFSVTPARAALVDFLPPVVLNSYTLAALQPDPHPHTSLWLFTEPFVPQVWGLVFAMFFVAFGSWWLTERLSPFGARASQFSRAHRREAKVAVVAYKSTLSILEVETHVPNATSARLVTLGFFAFVLVFIYMYDASLTAIEVAAGQASGTPLTFAELQRSPGPLGVLANSSLIPWVTQNSVASIRALAPYLVPQPSYTVMAERIESGALLAGIGSTTTLMYALASDNHCIPVGVAQGDAQEFVFFALPSTPGAPWFAQLSGMFTALQTDGAITALMQTDFYDVIEAGCPAELMAVGSAAGQVMPATLTDIAGQLIVFCSILVVAAAMFLVELGVYCFVDSPNQNWRALNIILGHDYPKTEDHVLKEHETVLESVHEKRRSARARRRAASARDLLQGQTAGKAGSVRDRSWIS